MILLYYGLYFYNKSLLHLFFSTRPYENMLAFFINAFSMHSIGLIRRAFQTNKNFAWNLSLKTVRLTLVVRQYTNYYSNTNFRKHTNFPTCKMTVSQQLL